MLVVASGGPAHFRAFLEWVAVDPVARLGRQAHPLDAFSADVFARLTLPGARVVFPTFLAPLQLDFVKMAELAGLGRPSELGLLVDERFGPWLALRAADLHARGAARRRRRAPPVRRLRGAVPRTDGAARAPPRLRRRPASTPTTSCSASIITIARAAARCCAKDSA